MNRSLLLGYQLLTGVSDTATGALLIMAPAFTLELLRLPAPSADMVYLSFIGAFVLSVGICNLYGAYVVYRRRNRRDLEMVWLLTAFTRASVAFFVGVQVMTGDLPSGWLMVAAFDGFCVLFQALGLYKKWPADAL